MRRTAVLGILCIAVACAMGAADRGALNSADKAFIRAAAEANMTEAHVGQMAQNQASDNNVKTFGTTLATDHTKAYEELTALSDKIGESIPKGIDIRRNRTVETLMHQKGARFDRMFVHDEIQDHEKTIAEFRREAEIGHNPDVKAYAQQMIPKLEEHLHKAQELEKSENQTASAAGHSQGR